MNKGDRVVAISHGKDRKIWLFGVGVYEGREIPPPEINPALREITGMDTPNPKIRLDDGKVVWGCECWWGPERKLEEYRKAGFEILNVDIDDAREKARTERP